MGSKWEACDVGLKPLPGLTYHAFPGLSTVFFGSCICLLCLPVQIPAFCGQCAFNREGLQKLKGLFGSLEPGGSSK
jgi:hypothetical protein